MPTPFPPEDFLAVAKTLRTASVPNTEGRWRTVCGRAYYAVWKATSNAICTLHGHPVDSTFPHEATANKIASTPKDDDMREFGDALNSLRALRIHADYKLARPFRKELEADAVKDSTEALELLDKVKGRLPNITPTY